MPAGEQPQPRGSPIAVYDPLGDQMIVVGGLIGVNQPGDCWALRLGGNPVWQVLPPQDRWSHAGIYDPLRHAVIVHGGFAYYSVGGMPTYVPDAAALRMPLLPSPSWQPYSGSWVYRLWEHAAIYDPAAARMVVYGGYTTSCYEDCLSSTTWAYSLSGEAVWTEVEHYGPYPARANHSAVYDPLRERLLVFGGNREFGGRLNDTWALSLTGPPQWSQVAATGTLPAPRNGHSAIYDPVRDRMLVFGGSGGSGNDSDVWELSLAEAPVWRQLSTTGTPPSPRSEHSAIYDPVGDRMVVFGGAADNDVWALSLAGSVPTWSVLGVTGERPAPRARHSAVYDPLRERMVVFGGTNERDVWVLDLGNPAAGAAWSRFDAAGAPPENASDHTAIYDPTGDRMVVFGGGTSPAVNALTFEETAAVSNETPSLPGLWLEGARPNPAFGEPTVFFVVPSPAPTSIEVVDVTGRLLARRSLGALAPGGHRVVLGIRLPAGTYLLRLKHGEWALSSKVSITR